MPTQERGPTVQATETSLDILELLNRKNSASGAEIADQLDIARSTAHTHLNTLQTRGYLSKTRFGEFQIGLRFLDFAERARKRDHRFKIIERKVQELAEETGREVDFHMEENGRLILVHRTIGDTRDEHFQQSSYKYLHNTAAGKAILAELPSERVDRILDRWGMNKETEQTITDREQLFGELETVKETGISYNDEESIEGFHCTGSVVKTPDDRVFGAMTIGGPTYLVSESVLKQELNEELQEVVNQIEDQLEPNYPVSSVLSE